MSLKRLLSFLGTSATAGVLVLCPSPSLAGELPPSKPVEYSDPFTSEEEAREVTHSQSDIKSEGLKPSGMGASGSLRGMPAPIAPIPARTQVVSPNRLQDINERRKDWVFREPESLLDNPQKQEVLGAAREQEDENLSPMEQFYLKFISPKTTREEEGASTSSTSLEKESLLPEGLRTTEAFLQEITTQARQSSLSGARADTAEFLGGGSSVIGPELTPAQKFRQEAFRQLLQESFVIPNQVAGMDANKGFSQPTFSESFKAENSFSSIDSRTSASSLLRAPETQLGVVPPMPSLLDVNTRALTPQTPALMAPGAQQQQLPGLRQPKSVNSAPSRPTFTAPRRPF